MCGFMQYMSPLLCANIYRFMVIMLLKVNFCPFKGGRLGGRFYLGLGVKTPTLFFTDIITMATSITLGMISLSVCFVFQKARLFHSFASETCFIPLIFYENGTFCCVCEFIK